MMTPDHTYTPRTFTPQIYTERTFALKGLDGISDAQIEEHFRNVDWPVIERRLGESSHGGG